MEPRRNSMRRAHPNYSEFRNSAYGTEGYPPYPPPDYPGSEPNVHNMTPEIPSINQSEVSNQVSSAYGPVVDGVSTRLRDERNPRSVNSASPGYYDNNDHHPHYRSFSQVTQRSIHDYVQPISSSGNFEILWDTPASIKREKKGGSCRKVAKWIVMATILVGIPFLVAFMSYQNLFSTTDDSENPGISDLQKQIMDNQLHQNETINNSLKDLQNQTQSLLPRVISSVKRYFDDLRQEYTTYIQQRYPGCCGNRVNITVGDCVDDCTNVDDGNYHSCKTCRGFVTCSNQGIDYLDCPENLVWDDILDRCEWYSDTCRI